MELLALGVSHKTAPVAVRERLAFSDNEARRFLDELVREDAQEAVVISTCNRTELYVVASDPVQAEPHLRRAAELAGSSASGPVLQWAELLQSLGRSEEAERLFGRAQQQSPDNPRVQLGLARLAFDRNALEECRSLLVHAEANPSTRKAAHALLAEVCQRLGDRAGAERELNLVASLPDDLDWPDPFRDEVARLRVGELALFRQASQLLRAGQRPALALLP